MPTRAFLAATLIVAASGAARAECAFQPFEFFPERNRDVTVITTIDSGSTCRHRFAEGPGYHFTGFATALEPKHGVIAKTADGAFVYTPTAGYLGKDLYGFKICATLGKASGCSKILFDATVRAASAQSDCGKGAPETVIPACTRIIDDAAKSAKERIEALNWRALAHSRKGDTEGAIADFSAVLAIDPKNAEALSNRGVMHASLGQNDAALADYSAAIAAAPDKALAWVNRSIVLRRKGDIDGAIADAGHAIALAPRQASGYAQRAMALMQRGEAPAALDDLTQAITLDPANAETRTLRGDAERAGGDLAKARDDYDTAIKLMANYAPAYYGRGHLALLGSDLDAATRDLDVALSLSPKNFAYLNEAGATAMQRGDFAAAIAKFDEALRIAPDKTGIHANRGFAHFAAGEFSAAGDDFDALAAGLPNQPYAALWRQLARLRAGSADAPALGSIDPAAPWPAPVVAFFAGKLSAAELDAAAGKAKDEQERTSQRCDAAFYAGERAILDKRDSDAAALMRSALAVCTPASLERAAAIGEAKRLK